MRRTRFNFSKWNTVIFIILIVLNLTTQIQAQSPTPSSSFTPTTTPSITPSTSVSSSPSPIHGDLKGDPVGAKEHKNEIIAIVFGIIGGLFAFAVLVGGVAYVFERRVREEIRHERAKERPALKKKATVGTLSSVTQTGTATSQHVETR